MFYFLFVVMLGMGGFRQLAEIVLPIAGAYFLYSYFKENQIKNYRSFIKNEFIILAPYGVGYIIYEYICHTHTIIQTETGSLVYAESLEQLTDNLIYISSVV